MKCPVCGCGKFFVKDPEDHFSMFTFEIKDTRPIFDDPEEEAEAPEVVGETETFCTKCAWHDRMEKLTPRRQ